MTLFPRDPGAAAPGDALLDIRAAFRDLARPAPDPGESIFGFPVVVVPVNAIPTGTMMLVPPRRPHEADDELLARSVLVVNLAATS